MCTNHPSAGPCDRCPADAVYLVMTGGRHPQHLLACREHVDAVRATAQLDSGHAPTVVEACVLTAAGVPA